MRWPTRARWAGNSAAGNSRLEIGPSVGLGPVQISVLRERHCSGTAGNIHIFKWDLQLSWLLASHLSKGLVWLAGVLPHPPSPAPPSAPPHPTALPAAAAGGGGRRCGSDAAAVGP